MFEVTQEGEDHQLPPHVQYIERECDAVMDAPVLYIAAWRGESLAPCRQLWSARFPAPTHCQVQARLAAAGRAHDRGPGSDCYCIWSRLLDRVAAVPVAAAPGPEEGPPGGVGAGGGAQAIEVGSGAGDGSEEENLAEEVELETANTLVEQGGELVGRGGVGVGGELGGGAGGDVRDDGPERVAEEVRNINSSQFLCDIY